MVTPPAESAAMIKAAIRALEYENDGASVEVVDDASFTLVNWLRRKGVKTARLSA